MVYIDLVNLYLVAKMGAKFGGETKFTLRLFVRACLVVVAADVLLLCIHTSIYNYPLHSFCLIAAGPDNSGNGLLVSHGKPKSVTASILRDGLSSLDRAGGGVTNTPLSAHLSASDSVPSKRKRRKAMISDSDSSESEIDVEAISKMPVLPGPAQPLVAAHPSSAPLKEKTPPPFYAAPPTTSTSSRSKSLVKKNVSSAHHPQSSKVSENTLQLVVCVDVQKLPTSKPAAAGGTKTRVDGLMAHTSTTSSKPVVSGKPGSESDGDLPSHLRFSIAAAGKKKKRKKHKKKKLEDEACVVQPSGPLKLRICLGKS